MLFFKTKTRSVQFESCVRPYLPDMYRFAYRLTGNQHDAEDLVQDTVLKVYRSNTNLEGLDQVRSWLGKVLYRQFVDHYRSRLRAPVMVSSPDDESGFADMEDEAADVEQLTSRRQMLSNISNAIDSMSDEHRVLIIMFEVEGYSLAEMQEVLDLPMGTLKSRLHRARAKLREILESSGTFSEAQACLVQRA